MAFSLDLPDAEAVKKQVALDTAPTVEEKNEITTIVSRNCDEIMTVDLDSVQSRHEIVSVVEDFGKALTNKSNNSNALLQKRLVNLGNRDSGAEGVAKDLEDLSIRMRDLDPSGIDFAKTGFLGKLINPVRRYFEKYKTADKEIADIIKSLDRGKKTLQNDNTTLEIEEVNMRNTTKELNQKIETGRQLDEALSAAIENERLKGGNEERVKFVEDEILFPLRQKLLDFEQLLVVNQQGIVAMEVIRKNNGELMRSVDRAKTVTVASLRTAVTVAGALYDQKIVLEKINILNEATNNMIASTSRMLKEQGVSIQRQAVESGVSVDTLKQSFAECLQAMDDISNYRREALPQMKMVIDEFKSIAEEGNKQLQLIDEKERIAAELANTDDVKAQS